MALIVEDHSPVDTGPTKARAIIERKWLPIETAPKDAVIQRWHKIWNAPISVSRNNQTFVAALEWITACKSTSWPEEAFTPHWMPLPEPPSP